MADLGLVDALFLLTPTKIQDCTYSAFKYLWNFYGVPRVQISHIDPINSPVRTTYDLLIHKSYYSECFHEYMQDLYRIVSGKLLAVAADRSQTPQQIWCIYALYTLFFTQSPPLGSPPQPIYLPLGMLSSSLIYSLATDSNASCLWIHRTRLNLITHLPSYIATFFFLLFYCYCLPRPFLDAWKIFSSLFLQIGLYCYQYTPDTTHDCLLAIQSLLRHDAIVFTHTYTPHAYLCVLPESHYYRPALVPAFRHLGAATSTLSAIFPHLQMQDNQHPQQQGGSASHRKVVAMNRFITEPSDVMMTMHVQPPRLIPHPGVPACNVSLTPFVTTYHPTGSGGYAAKACPQTQHYDPHVPTPHDSTYNPWCFPTSVPLTTSSPSAPSQPTAWKTRQRDETRYPSLPYDRHFPRNKESLDDGFGFWHDLDGLIVYPFSHGLEFYIQSRLQSRQLASQLQTGYTRGSSRHPHGSTVTSTTPSTTSSTALQEQEHRAQDLSRLYASASRPFSALYRNYAHILLSHPAQAQCGVTSTNTAYSTPYLPISVKQEDATFHDLHVEGVSMRLGVTPDGSIPTLHDVSDSYHHSLMELFSETFHACDDSDVSSDVAAFGAAEESRSHPPLATATLAASPSLGTGDDVLRHQNESKTPDDLMTYLLRLPKQSLAPERPLLLFKAFPMLDWLILFLRRIVRTQLQQRTAFLDERRREIKYVTKRRFMKTQYSLRRRDRQSHSPTHPQMTSGSRLSSSTVLHIYHLMHHMHRRLRHHPRHPPPFPKISSTSLPPEQAFAAWSSSSPYGVAYRRQISRTYTIATRYDQLLRYFFGLYGASRHGASSGARKDSIPSSSRLHESMYDPFVQSTSTSSPHIERDPLAHVGDNTTTMLSSPPSPPPPSSPSPSPSLDDDVFDKSSLPVLSLFTLSIEGILSTYLSTIESCQQQYNTAITNIKKHTTIEIIETHTVRDMPSLSQQAQQLVQLQKKHLASVPSIKAAAHLHSLMEQHSNLYMTQQQHHQHPSTPTYQL